MVSNKLPCMMGVYTPGSLLLGVYILTPLISDPSSHSWGYTLLGVYTPGGLHSWGSTPGGLHSHTTDFGSINPLQGVSTTEGLRSQGSTLLGVYTPTRPISDPVDNSPALKHYIEPYTVPIVRSWHCKKGRNVRHYTALSLYLSLYIYIYPYLSIYIYISLYPPIYFMVCIIFLYGLR